MLVLLVYLTVRTRSLLRATSAAVTGRATVANDGQSARRRQVASLSTAGLTRSDDLGLAPVERRSDRRHIVREDAESRELVARDHDEQVECPAADPERCVRGCHVTALISARGLDRIELGPTRRFAEEVREALFDVGLGGF